LTTWDNLLTITISSQLTAYPASNTAPSAVLFLSKMSWLESATSLLISPAQKALWKLQQVILQSATNQKQINW
jgi:hypothetical protein